MTWRWAAIVVCATVAVLAGAVSVVAGAVTADRTTARAAASDSPGAAKGGSSAYRSSVTITLDGPTATCASSPDAEQPGPRLRPLCDAPGRLPKGATEQDVLRALGEPQRRRTLNAGAEAWDYSWYVDDRRDAFDASTLTLAGHRLVDAEEYDFK